MFKYESAKDPLPLSVFCDSNYAGDQDTQISLTGFCIFLMGGVPIHQRAEKCNYGNSIIQVK